VVAEPASYWAVRCSVACALRFETEITPIILPLRCKMTAGDVEAGGSGELPVVVCGF